MVDSYEGDEHIKSMLEKLALGNKEVEGYTLMDGLLRYKGKIVVGNSDELEENFAILA